ncbi:predicted protein [Sclerotinia sclerotiorum 1980 UF-70]|uniref:Uncharacterized protein n=1 Tax=Sclerotinia sclerotiorum (strain ATCC 18683 / 1980 / Ss-1) TaxID=665079 RepID=A7EQB9_SCLS1|nr:predicted protein [Sclerotinia sclerotiorum 1980 UF-70]EDO05035.1 predicted protein [Sclerotinia sclerotiorum 1980 UF-70]
MFHTLETRLPMCVAGKIGFHHKLSTYGAFPKILHKPTRLQYCPFHSIQIWIILFFAHPGIPSISLYWSEGIKNRRSDNEDRIDQLPSCLAISMRWSERLALSILNQPVKIHLSGV